MSHTLGLRPLLRLVLVLLPMMALGGRYRDGHAPTPPVKVTLSPKPSGIPFGKALQALQAGNLRYLQGGVTVRSWIQESIIKTGEQGQSPSVAVLGCSDSRVPVELVFDLGVGDLFVVRMAGNYQSTDSVGTLEFGFEELGVHTLLVLGHTKCGAVTATLRGAEVSGDMKAFLHAIRPALDSVPGGIASIKTVNEAVEINARWQLQQLLARSEILHKAKEEGKLQLLVGIYDVSTGMVRFLN